jgi:predicted GH43/DUF377 family glycosyl hydrolase
MQKKIFCFIAVAVLLQTLCNSDATKEEHDGTYYCFYNAAQEKVEQLGVALSNDLLHWTADPEPLYKFGGHPTGLDQKYAHKISLVFNQANKKYYMFYCAVGNKGRTIGLLVSDPIK